MTVIATRTLTLDSDSGGDVEIPIQIFAPEQNPNSWICRFAIGWPGGKVEQWAAGEDAMQALVHALQMIGVIIYTSEHHEAGRLKWFEPGTGYGFPVMNNVRDLLIGDDAKYL